MATRKNNPRGMGVRERSELFQKRRAAQRKFSFLEVDHATLFAALETAIAEGATLSFAPAQGGIGCTVRVYMGDTADTEFVGSPQEMTELLEMFIRGLTSSSEDVITITKSLLLARYPST